nr:HAMP domain-containing sensor histidine kinase [uncultured Acetatifactor sp.]
MAFFSFLSQNFILAGVLQGAAFPGRDILEGNIPAAILLCVLFAVMGGYFAFRYFALKRALREMNRDLLEIQKDVSRNQILHLPLPDRALEQAMESVNGTLEEVRRQRLEYEKRETEFQKQMEDISHDLRTPLTVILGYLKWMKRDMAQSIALLQMESPDIPAQTTTQAAHPHQAASEDTSKQRTAQKAAWEMLSRQAESLEILERNARAMERLVSQFYAFSQLNAREYSLEIRDVDICRLLKESLAGHWQMLEKACLRLESFLPEHPVMVRGNKDACERIFANMLQNAGRYARSYLDISLSESCGLVQIFFQNDSVRLKEDDIPNLFHRFYKNDVSRSKGGSGLGLTIAKSLAEAMGGTLTAQALPPAELSPSQNADDAKSHSLYLDSDDAESHSLCLDSDDAESHSLCLDAAGTKNRSHCLDSDDAESHSLCLDAAGTKNRSRCLDSDDAETTVRFTLTLTAVLPQSGSPGAEAPQSKPPS